MQATQEELDVLRQGGKRLATIMEELVAMVAPGVSTADLEEHAQERAYVLGDTPAFLGYQPSGANRPYPAALCTSVNEQVVHGIPNEEPYMFKNGDIVTLDMGLVHEGLVTDMAVTVGVENISDEVKRLIDAAQEALTVALETARAGNTTGDIGHAVQRTAEKYGYSVPRELGGHGVGNDVHEEPFIPNFGTPGSGTTLTAGMILAIEPIIIQGKGAIVLADDGYTYKTHDGSWAAQFEHSVRITEGSPEILTISNVRV